MRVARAARVRVVSVVDHDTVAGLDAAHRACATLGLELVPGIEITAVRNGEDVHVLGYFFDAASPALLAFLENQRADRRRRVGEILERLAGLGIRLDPQQVLADASGPGQSPGRPLIARALVRAGVVRTTSDAFDWYLGQNRAAFVPRRASSPEEVVRIIHDAGGVASLAHPGLLGHEDWVDQAAAIGFDAVEVHHPAHDRDAVQRYLAVAARDGLGVSGGSDYHGDPSHGPERPGAVALPDASYADLCRRAGREVKGLQS